MNVNEQRAYLYKLQDKGIVKSNREKDKEEGLYTYSWELTDKGKDLTQADDHLKEMWENQNIKEFYDEVMKGLGNRKI